MGGAHHPLLGVSGVMSATDTVVDVVMLRSFLSFLIYRRGNKGERVPIAQQSRAAKITLVAITALAVWLLFLMQPDRLRLAGAMWVLWGFELPMIVLALLLTLVNRGTWGQALLFAMSATVVVFFGAYGYFVEAIVRIG